MRIIPEFLRGGRSTIQGFQAVSCDLRLRTNSLTTSVLERPVSRQYLSSHSFSTFDRSTCSRTLSFRVAILTSQELLGTILANARKMARHLWEQVPLALNPRRSGVVQNNNYYEYTKPGLRSPVPCSCIVPFRWEGGVVT